MKYTLPVFALFLLALPPISAQVASHAPTALAKQLQPGPAIQAPAKPVARVNGAVLTERDLLREMYAMFPYARQHNGEIPREMEPGIRDGALKMIEFEELVYQEAQRRKLTVPEARVDRAEADFRKQFPDRAEFDRLMQEEFHGSRQELRNKVRRSLLIEAFLKVEVGNKSQVSVAEARAFYDKNPEKFVVPESFNIQTISILPPKTANPEQLKEAKKRAQDLLIQAKATKSYAEFGVLAEKTSDDDWHVMMGDHRAVERAKLSPPVVQALLAMKTGQVSDLIQISNAYTIVRLNGHTPTGKKKFAEIQQKLQQYLQKKKENQLRANLGQELRKHAKVEELL